MKSRWVRRHIATFEVGVLGTAKFRAVQIFKNTSENSKVLYSNFCELIGCIEFPIYLYQILH